MEENISDSEFSCAGKNEGYDMARFALVTYVGTPIAMLGIVFNGLLMVNLVRIIIKNLYVPDLTSSSKCFFFRSSSPAKNASNHRRCICLCWPYSTLWYASSICLSLRLMRLPFIIKTRNYIIYGIHIQCFCMDWVG